MKLPFVSIVIPTLNEEKVLERTLLALEKQDYKGRFEIIVADSMSKDKTVGIARKYADKVLKVKKRSVGAGRNAGTEAARGELVFFLDADTTLLPNGLSALVGGFRKGVVGVSCPFLPDNPTWSNTISYLIYNFNVKMSIKLNSPMVAGSCCGYRKDSIEKVGGFSETSHLFEDFDLSRRISKLGKIMIIKNHVVLSSTRRLDYLGVWGSLTYLTNYLKFLFGKNRFGREQYPTIRQ